MCSALIWVMMVAQTGEGTNVLLFDVPEEVIEQYEFADNFSLSDDIPDEDIK